MRFLIYVRIFNASIIIAHCFTLYIICYFILNCLPLQEVQAGPNLKQDTLWKVDKQSYTPNGFFAMLVFS